MQKLRPTRGENSKDFALREAEAMKEALAVGLSDGEALSLPGQRLLSRGPAGLWLWLRTYIERVYWEPGVIKTPREVLQTRRADCKGLAILAAALGELYGYPAGSWLIVGWKRRMNCWEHIVTVFTDPITQARVIVDPKARRFGQIQGSERPQCVGMEISL